MLSIAIPLALFAIAAVLLTLDVSPRTRAPMPATLHPERSATRRPRAVEAGVSGLTSCPLENLP